MANWILGHTDRFKCIVTHDGMFNPFSAWGTTEELWFNNWEFGGTPYTAHDTYNKWSPRNSAKNFKTPTLVVHGQRAEIVDVGFATHERPLGIGPGMRQQVPILSGAELRGVKHKAIVADVSRPGVITVGRRRRVVLQVHVGFAGGNVQRSPPRPDGCVLGADFKPVIAAVGVTLGSPEYWVARSSRAMTAVSFARSRFTT